MRGEGAYVESLKAFYAEKSTAIASRLEDYRRVWEEGDNDSIHAELSFCILTPQSKARAAWAAITALRENGLLYHGNAEEIAPFLRSVRFYRTKAANLVRLREQMTGEDGNLRTRDFFNSLGQAEAWRAWIVQNVRGMSYKEAGHFIRNVGHGEDLAILDRHILKNLQLAGVIREVPESLSSRVYLEIEKKMRAFCKRIKIPMGAMDLLLWCMETGEIFK